jgi:hypothetical protein
MYSFIRRLFATETRPAARRARAITKSRVTRTQRTRPSLENLEDRLVPSTVYEVVPLSSPTDATHFHTFQQAYQAAQSATHDIVQIEPGAAVSVSGPTVGGLKLDKANITIQGDPRFGQATVAIGVEVEATATGVTLNDLNFGANGLRLGYQTTVENSTLAWVAAGTNHYGDYISNNTITGFLDLYGNSAIQTYDLVQLNTFTGINGLQISADNGAYINANTFLLQGSTSGATAIQVANSQNVSIHDNSIAFNTASIQNVGISVQDLDSTGTPGTTSVHLWYNTINTGFNGGRGLVLTKYNTTSNSLSANVELNDFRNNGTGVWIVGDGTSAGTIDLGGGALGSGGDNNFSDFTPLRASAGYFAISLHGTNATSRVWARNNIWDWQQSSSGYLPIDPTLVISDGRSNVTSGSLAYYGGPSTGFIDVTSTSSGSYGGGGGGSSGTTTTNGHPPIVYQ